MTLVQHMTPESITEFLGFVERFIAGLDAVEVDPVESKLVEAVHEGAVFKGNDDAFIAYTYWLAGKASL